MIAPEAYRYSNSITMGKGPGKDVLVSVLEIKKIKESRP
jgi:hypothetical protein